jgi:hypothetical protein
MGYGNPIRCVQSKQSNITTLTWDAAHQEIARKTADLALTQKGFENAIRFLCKTSAESGCDISQYPRVFHNTLRSLTLQRMAFQALLPEGGVTDLHSNCTVITLQSPFDL